VSTVADRTDAQGERQQKRGRSWAFATGETARAT